MNAKLILLNRKEKRPVLKLKKLPMTLGRGDDADLTIRHGMISRKHCELYEIENTLCIRDLGSLNGTFVGDVRVEEASLESGDILTVGSAKFEVVIEEDAVLMPPGLTDNDVDTDIGKAAAGSDLVEVVDTNSPASDPAADFDQIIDAQLAEDAEELPVNQQPARSMPIAKKDAAKKEAAKKVGALSPKSDLAEKRTNVTQAAAAKKSISQTIEIASEDPSDATIDATVDADEDDLSEFLAGLE